MIPATERRHPLVLAILAVAAAVLFACSGDREAVGMPQADPVAQDGLAAPDTVAQPTDPAGSQTAAPAGAGDVARRSTGWEIEEDEVDAAAESRDQGETPVQAPTGAGSESRRAKSPAPAGERVFTNADLKRYRPLKAAFGFDDTKESTGIPDSGERDADSDAATGGEGKKSGETTILSPEERQKKIDSTMNEIASLEEELQSLKDRIPSLHNPFLARVEPLEEDREAETGLDNAQRLQHVEQRIAETEKRLQDAEGRLAALQQERDPAADEQ